MARYIDDETYTGWDFSERALEVCEYNACSFINCNFQHVDLAGIKFFDCTFAGCNMSMAGLQDTSFRDAVFTACKLLGLHFYHCNPILFSASFEDCILSHASFYRLKLKNMEFKNCKLIEVDFSEADLSGAKFTSCELTDAVFANTLLEKADLSAAYNYAIDPEINRIKGALFSLSGLPGLLGRYGIEVV